MNLLQAYVHRCHELELFSQKRTQVRAARLLLCNLHFFIGDKWRPVRFKQISSVLWQGGAGKLPLRLIVIAPIPYRLSFHSRAFYRRPAYFLCDNPPIQQKRHTHTNEPLSCHSKSSVPQLLNLQFKWWAVPTLRATRPRMASL
jgi:hypothetical protein